MTKNSLNSKIAVVERIAKMSKIGRLLNNPYRYISSMLFREFIYPRRKKEKTVDCKLFTGKPMKIALPASMDIYLTGGKSHISEIRLAKFLISQLKPDSRFLDIGAHYGYFTLIATAILDDRGEIYAYEPAKSSYRLLKANTERMENVKTFPLAVSNSDQDKQFYEFSNLHSEYNSMDIAQFEHEHWYQQNKPEVVTVKATTIDTITQSSGFKPDMIKIDVEGAEHEVIEGGIRYFQANAPQIIMEYLAPDRKNDTHKIAFDRLLGLGYRSYRIGDQGELIPITEVDRYLIDEHLESDNIVFSK
jgi:FkbM family methyltransferase